MSELSCVNVCKFYIWHYNCRYVCNCKNLKVSSRDAQIEEVTGSHMSSRSDQDVATFYAFNPAAKYVPKRLGFVFPNLKILMITKSGLKLIEFRDFKNMKKLQKLYLFDNMIEKLPLCVFKYAENLEVIDLSGNRITELEDDTFVNLPSLQQFLANGNGIEHLKNGLFRNNPSLKKLSMSNNKISFIGINFLKLKDIELIDLRQNTCINLSFGCCKGPALREFQNHTFYWCKSSDFL